MNAVLPGPSQSESGGLAGGREGVGCKQRLARSWTKTGMMQECESVCVCVVSRGGKVFIA